LLFFFKKNQGTSLFTFLNRKDISAATSFSCLEVLLRCRKQIPYRKSKLLRSPESSTGILTGFPFAIDEEPCSLSLRKKKFLTFLKCLTPRLGSAHSQRIALFEITLFTSVDKDSHLSNYYYYQDLH